METKRGIMSLDSDLHAFHISDAYSQHQYSSARATQESSSCITLPLHELSWVVISYAACSHLEPEFHHQNSSAQPIHLQSQKFSLFILQMSMQDIIIVILIIIITGDHSPHTITQWHTFGRTNHDCSVHGVHTKIWGTSTRIIENPTVIVRVILELKPP